MEGRVLFLPVYAHVSLISSAIAIDSRSCHRAHNSKCLCVLIEFLQVRVLIESSPLALEAKELFQWVLGHTLTQEHLDTRQSEQVADQCTKDFTAC